MVYRNISLDEVKRKYPISEKKKIDYRYVTYSDSISYFNENIIDVLNMKEEGYPMGTLADRLKAIKEQITPLLLGQLRKVVKGVAVKARQSEISLPKRHH